MPTTCLPVSAGWVALWGEIQVEKFKQVQVVVTCLYEQTDTIENITFPLSVASGN